MERPRDLSTDEVFINSLTDIVLDNLRNDQFGAEELARQVGASRSQIHRKLHRIAGKSLTQFIREIRLEQAYTLLVNDAGTAAEIAYRVGFNSPTYFNTCFHEHFGMPPGEIKKKNNDGVKSMTDRRLVLSPIASHKHLEPPGIKISKNKTEARKKIFIITTIAVLLLGITAIVIISFLPAAPLKSLIKIYQEGQKSIAVLPFAHEGTSADINFANGVMADIHYNLSMIGALKVISKTSMQRYKESRATIRKISRELNVDYLLEGTVQSYDQQVRIHVNLIDGKSDKIIWAQVFQKHIDQYFQIQSEIAREIAHALLINITPEEIERIENIPTSNQRAYSHYAKAREEHSSYWVHNDSTNLIKAIQEYKEAIKSDSGFARALAGLGLAYYDRIGVANLDDLQSPYWDSINLYSQKALLADSKLSDAQLINGIYLYGKLGKIKQAIQRINLALKYDPNNFMAYKQKALLLSRVDGRVLETIQSLTAASQRIRGKELAGIYCELARNFGAMGFYEESKAYLQLENNILDNEIHFHNELAFLEFSVGNYASAIALFEFGLEIDSSRFISPVYLIAAGLYERAYLESLKYLKEFDNEPWIADLHRIGFSFWQAGDRKRGSYFLNMQIEKCEQAIKEQTHFAQRKYSYYDLAATYAFLGETEKAIQALEGLKHKQSYPVYAVNFLRRDDPLFDNLREDPRYIEVVDHVEKRYHREHQVIQAWLSTQASLK